MTGAVIHSRDIVSCLDDETLAAWSEGTLVGEQQAAAAGHVESCESCRAIAALLSEEHTGLLGGRYRLERCIGEGASGSVWSAFDVVASTRVAVKVLRSSTPESRARLTRELVAGRQVEHPAVLSARDIVVDGDEIALAFELLEGQTLREHQAGRVLPAGDSLRLCVEIVGGLAAIHAAGIIHRDLKPANVFVTTEGHAKIIDLGLAKVGPEALSLSMQAFQTRTGTKIGTPLYMAPEQVRGESGITPAADIWSLGIVLYECLTGSRPFEEQTLASLLLAMDRRASVPLATRAPHLDPVLHDLVDCMLAHQPEERPAAIAVRTVLCVLAQPSQPLRA